MGGRGERGVRGRDRARVLVRPFHEIGVGLEVAYLERHAAGLPVPQHLALVTEPEVELGQGKAVARGLERGQALAGRGVLLRGAAQVDDAGRVASSHAASELMQSGQAEAIGVQHDHGRGVRHVDAHLHHRGRDEHLRGAAAEALHRAVLLLGAHPAGKDVALDTGQDALAKPIQGRDGRAELVRGGDDGVRDILEAGAVVGVVHQRTDHVCLVPRRERVAHGPPREVEVIRRDDLGRYPGARPRPA